MAGGDADAAVDALFDLAPEEFTAARDLLARELRATDRARAAEVKALRKPTVAAWAVNQALRRRGELGSDLEAAASATRRAQQALLSGRGSTAVRDATAQRRAAVRAGVDAAVAALAGAGRATSEAVREAIAAIFDAAVLDEDALVEVRAARLSKELEAPAGLGDVGGFTLLPSGGSGRPDADRGPGREPADGGAGGDAAAEAEDEAARAEERAAERARREGLADRAEAAAARAEAEHRRAASEVTRLEAELATAGERLARAEGELAAARDAAAAARTAVDAVPG